MDQVEIFKALSNKTRLLILQWLKEPEVYFPEYYNDAYSKEITDMGVCVGQIQQKAKLTQSTVESTRVGQWTYYKRNEEGFRKLKSLIDTEI
jgi:DNA-binding transcriptional ArsR family regulator